MRDGRDDLHLGYPPGQPKPAWRANERNGTSGMSVCEIRAFLAKHYDTEVSPDFISSVTDEVMAEALSRQNRPLETMYPVAFFDTLRVKIRNDGVASNQAVYLALDIQANG